MLMCKRVPRLLHVHVCMHKLRCSACAWELMCMHKWQHSACALLRMRKWHRARTAMLERTRRRKQAVWGVSAWGGVRRSVFTAWSSSGHGPALGRGPGVDDF